MPRRTAQPASEKTARGGQLLVSKRGVYLIGRRSKVRSFRLITWAQILARLEA
jgi:hypothetical protein